jgi:hypothetical protein
MDELRKSTIMKNSGVINNALKWNPERFVDGKYIYDLQTVHFF